MPDGRAPLTTDPDDLLRPLRRTRQIREFEPTPLEPAVLDALADVARWTGSSQNSQPGRFIVITEPSTLRAIHAASGSNTRSFATAVAAIAISMPSDPARAVRDAYDEGRATERILVAATIVGIGAGISWIKPDARPAIASLLDLPQDRMIRTIVALGIPTEAARQLKTAPGTARLPRDEVVFRERWPAGGA